MQESRIRLLVLHAHYTTRLSFYADWYDSFSEFPGFSSTLVDIVRSDAKDRIRTALNEVDAVVLLHSTNGDTTTYLAPCLGLLADRRVPLLAFVGNEVNLPGSPIEEKRDALSAIRPEWIATQLLLEAGTYLFGDLASRGVVAIPHALNPKIFFSYGSANERPIDIGVRTAKYIPHIGDNDRNRIVDRFSTLTNRGLIIDVSDVRYDRTGWAKFLNRCKGTVGTEAGTWFLERDDATVNAVRNYVMDQKRRGLLIANDSRFRTLGHRLPWRLRAMMRRALRSGPVQLEAAINENTDFAEIYERFFSGRPRAPVYGKCISSRHFEAAGTKTCQIMFRGRFNDILRADEHYIALDDDFGNLDAALARFTDPVERSAVVEAAHEHVVGAHTYEHRMRQVYDLLNGGTSSAIDRGRPGYLARH